MGLFKRKKKNENKEPYMEPEEKEVPKGKKLTTKKEARQYALDYCGQMIQASKELQETKKEYKKLSIDLRDIDILENLPGDQKNKVTETAKNMVALQKTRNEFKNKAQRITDSQFAQMDQMEEEIPDAIKRLEANEKYQAAVKRDIHYLEGEKGEWAYYLSSLGEEQVLIRRLLMGIFVAFVVAVVILLVLYTGFEIDVRIPFIIVIAVVVFVSGGAFLKMQNNTDVLKKSQTNINRAITLLNSVKMRYVSVTSAVDYACEKYHVHNSKEMNYIWEQYLEAIKEQEKFEKTNVDLEYFTEKLLRDLKPLKLNDPSIWLHRAEAIVEPSEMVEVKHDLLERRQKLKNRIEQQVRTIQNSKVEIELLLIDKNIYEKEILDILNVIDNICRAKV